MQKITKGIILNFAIIGSAVFGLSLNGLRTPRSKENKKIILME